MWRKRRCHSIYLTEGADVLSANSRTRNDGLEGGGVSIHSGVEKSKDKPTPARQQKIYCSNWDGGLGW